MFKELGVEVKWEAIFALFFVVFWSVHWGGDMFSGRGPMDIYGCGSRSECIRNVVRCCDARKILEFNSQCINVAVDP